MGYATISELSSFGAAAAALASISDGDKTAAIDAASALADGYLRSRYTVPRTTYEKDLTIAVCKIATYDLLAQRGFNPSAGSDVNFRLRHDDAVKWLVAVSRGEVHLGGAPSDTPEYDQPVIVTSTRRGW